MHKRIPVNDVRLGMFIERLDGKWLDHPFWKKRFVLAEEHRLQTLLNSRVEWVVIDVDKGLDVAESPKPEEPSPVVQRLQRATSPARNLALSPRPYLPPATSAMQRQHKVRVQEFGKAKATARKAERQIEAMVVKAKLGGIVSSKTVSDVVEDVFACIERDSYAFSGLMRCKQGTPDIYRHSLIVSALMIALARKMALSREQVLTAGQAGLLMDIGHAYLTPGTPSEQHVQMGHEVLSAANDIPESILNVCLKHHERIDGSGMPFGLVEREIDELSRMAAICDTFATWEADDEQARHADPAVSVNEIVQSSGQFSENIMRHFIEAVGRYPIGSFLELQSGQLAMVVFGDCEGSDLPTVRTFYDLATGKKARGENIDLRNCYGTDRIVGTFDISSLDLGDPSALRERILAAALKE